MSEIDKPKAGRCSKEGCKAGCYACLCAKPCCPRKAQCAASDGCCSIPGKKPPLERPLLDCGGLTGECVCKTASPLNSRQQYCTCCFMILVVYILLGSIAQFVMFHFATLRCGGGSPKDDYGFPGGDDSAYGNASFNLLPKKGMLVEQDHTMWGMKFGVIAADDKEGHGGGNAGVWYRTGGPFFSTYTYQDTADSQPTVYMRGSIQNMVFGYVDDYVMRCDGKGSALRMSEGGHYFKNRIRHLLNMNQGYMFKVWKDGAMIATAKETYHGMKSVEFFYADDENGLNALNEKERKDNKTANITAGGDPFSNAYLNGLPFVIAGKDHVSWKFSNSVDQPIPYYQTSAMGTLFAFRCWTTAEKLKAAKARAAEHDKKTAAFLPETPQDVEKEELHE